MSICSRSYSCFSTFRSLFRRMIQGHKRVRRFLCVSFLLGVFVWPHRMDINASFSTCVPSRCVMIAWKGISAISRGVRGVVTITFVRRRNVMKTVLMFIISKDQNVPENTQTTWTNSRKTILSSRLTTSKSSR